MSSFEIDIAEHVPFDELDDEQLWAYGADLSTLLNNGRNADILRDFPFVVNTYAAGVDAAYERLLERRDVHKPGGRMQFAVFVGGAGCGLSVIAPDTPKPDIAPVEAANVSSFICEPYRRRGVGQFALRQRLIVIDQLYGGQAWTGIRAENEASIRNVVKAGFKYGGDYTNDRGTDLQLYTYHR